MGATRRKFTLEFKSEAAHRVIDTGRSVSEVARELSVGEDSLYRWVRDERRRIEAAMSVGEEPLEWRGARSSLGSAGNWKSCVRTMRSWENQPRTTHENPPSKKDLR